jgi:hypothetical protein
MHHGRTFACHKTVDYDLPPDHLDRNRRTCAGFLALMRREGALDRLQIVQLAERLAGIRLGELLDAGAPVYAGWREMIAAHERR